MKNSQKSNVQLLAEFENLCFRVAHDNGSQFYNKRLNGVEKELAKRLNISDEDHECYLKV